MVFKPTTSSIQVPQPNSEHELIMSLFCWDSVSLNSLNSEDVL